MIEENLPFSYLPGEWDEYDSSNYLGPVGDVWSVVINGIGLLSSGPLWDGGTYIFEATFQMLDKCTEGCSEGASGDVSLLDYRVYEDRVVSTVGGVFKPTWYQVYPGWDLSAIASISYTIDGEKSPFTFGGDEERGSGSLGLELSIDQKWTVDTGVTTRSSVRSQQALAVC